MDIADRCPNTIGGTAVDSSGCPADGDKDGVPDAVDKCPGTPAGTEVDENGCTRLFKATGRTMVLLGANNFETGKAIMTPDSRTALKDVAAALISQPQTKVEVAGYTDATGSKKLNARLSQARADSVRAFLIENGVPASQLTAKGYGPANPIAPNNTPEGRAKNRRVELIRR
jgi:OOP family OmpA-OmpF porin